MHHERKIQFFFFLTLASFLPMTHTSQKDCKWTLWAVPTSNLIGSWPKLWALRGYVSGQTRHQSVHVRTLMQSHVVCNISIFEPNNMTLSLRGFYCILWVWILQDIVWQGFGLSYCQERQENMVDFVDSNYEWNEDETLKTYGCFCVTLVISKWTLFTV